MAIAPELLEILACPKCKTPMAPEGRMRLRDDQGAFECDACRLAYRIVDGIPNFLIDEAEPLGGGP